MDKAEFEIVGTITQYSPDRAGKVARLQVRTRLEREAYHDVKYFGALAANDFKRGDIVRVTGRPGSEKHKTLTEQGRDGKTYPIWMTMLVAMRIELVSQGQSSIAGTQAPKQPDNDTDDIPF